MFVECFTLNGKPYLRLHLIRSFLKAGVMEGGLVSPTTEGVPQGGPLSPVLSNVYLDKLDKELEGRGLRFGWYRRSGLSTVNYLLSPKALALANKKEDRPGLIDPLAYYLGNT